MTTIKSILGWLLMAYLVLLASCSQSHSEPATYNSVSGQGYYNAPFTVTKITMHDNTICYVASESGHGISLQCFQNLVSANSVPPAK